MTGSGIDETAVGDDRAGAAGGDSVPAVGGDRAGAVGGDGAGLVGGDRAGANEGRPMRSIDDSSRVSTAESGAHAPFDAAPELFEPGGRD